MIKYTNLYSVLADSAYRKPEAPAIIAAGQTWSYHKLLMSVDRASDMLWQHGVRAGDKVALALRIV